MANNNRFSDRADDVRNEDRYWELEKADSTMQANFAGQNVDARNASQEIMRAGLKEDQASSARFAKLLEYSEDERGGEFIGKA